MSVFAARQTAEASMAAWAETTDAPALALAEDQRDNTFRVFESYEDGTVVLRRPEILIDMVWTPHSAGITKLKPVNAYSVGYCYPLYQAYEKTMYVPHGMADLTGILHDGIAEVNDEPAGWRTTSDPGKTFVDAISEGDEVCPWRDGLPVPEEVAHAEPLPIVLIRMAGGRIDDVSLVRGHAHVVVTNRDGEGLDRGPHLHVEDDLGDLLLTHWTGPDEVAGLPPDLMKHLGIKPRNSVTGDAA